MRDDGRARSRRNGAGERQGAVSVVHDVARAVVPRSSKMEY